MFDVIFNKILSFKSIPIQNSKPNLLRDFIYSQLSLLLFLFVSFLITPVVVFTNEGVSAFGINIKTIVPYAIGYFLCSYFLGRSVKYIVHDSEPYKSIFYAMNSIAILFVALVFTPYAINTSFNWIHTIISTLLFLIELGLVIYLVSISKKRVINTLLIIGQILSGIIAMFSVNPSSVTPGGLDLLLQGEFLFQLFFVFIILNTLSKYKINYTQ